MTEQKKEAADKSRGLKASQVVATALAAVTAAFLGSRLGVAGTVSGAGIASVVSSVGTSVYQRSLERTSRRLRSTVAKVGDRPEPPGPNGARPAAAPTRVAVPGRAPGPGYRGSPPSRPPGGMPGSPRISGNLTDAPTTPLRRPDPNAPTRLIGPGTPTPSDERTQVVAPPGGPHRHRIRWKLAAATTAIAFVVAMALVTVVELVHGGPISGGNEGTTLGRLAGEPTQRSSSTTTTTPTPTSTPPTSATTAPSSTPNGGVGGILPSLLPPGHTSTTAPTTTPPTTTAPADGLPRLPQAVTPSQTPSATGNG